MSLETINDRRLKQYLAGELILDQLAAGMTGREPYEIVGGEVREVPRAEYLSRMRERVPAARGGCDKVKARYEAARPDIEAHGPDVLRELLHATDALLGRMVDWSPCQRAARMRSILQQHAVARGKRLPVPDVPPGPPVGWPVPGPAPAAPGPVQGYPEPVMPMPWPTGGTIDLVVPLGTGSRHNDLELSFLLRSAATNLMGLRTVHLIGVRRPAWLTDLPGIRFHAVPQVQPKNHDIVSRFLYAARCPEVSELFVASCDDWVFLRPVDMVNEAAAVQAGGVLSSKADTNAWKRAQAETRRLLESAGKPVLWYDYHVPTVQSKAGWIKVDAEIPWRSVPGHAVWALYHNVAGTHGRVVGSAVGGGWHSDKAPASAEECDRRSANLLFLNYNDTGLNPVLANWINREPWRRVPRATPVVGLEPADDHLRRPGPWTEARLARLYRSVTIQRPNLDGYRDRMLAEAANPQFLPTVLPADRVITLGHLAGGHIGDVLAASRLPRVLTGLGYEVWCEDIKVMRAVFTGNPFVKGFSNDHPFFFIDAHRIGHDAHVAQYTMWQVGAPCEPYPRGELYLSEEELAWAHAERAKLPSDRPMIVVSTGCVSSQEAYAGPLDWQGIVDELSEDCSVVCPVVTQEAALAGRKNEKWRKADYVPLRCRVYENLPTRRFMALVAVADGAVGTMGGTSHVAAALDVPYLCILPFVRPPGMNLTFPMHGKHGAADARWLYPQHLFAIPSDRPAGFPLGWTDMRDSVFHPSDRGPNPERVAQCMSPAEKYLIAREYRPRRIVEIGVRYGYSALGFLPASPDAQYTGFDIISTGDGAEGGLGGGEDTFPFVRETLGRHVPAAKVSLVHADSQKLAEFPVADFYHIDGDHSFSGAYRDMEKALRACTPGGRLVIDDYYHLPEVRRACDTFAADHAAEIAQVRILPTWRGDMVIRKAGVRPVAGKAALIVVAYGLAGLRLDAAKKAIADWLLEESLPHVVLVEMLAEGGESLEPLFAGLPHTTVRRPFQREKRGLFIAGTLRNLGAKGAPPDCSTLLFLDADVRADYAPGERRTWLSDWQVEVEASPADTLVHGFRRVHGVYGPDSVTSGFGWTRHLNGTAGHPGLAWGMSRSLFDRVGGYSPWPLARGDDLFLLAECGLLDPAVAERQSPAYAGTLRHPISGVGLRFVDRDIVHEDHGPVSERRASIAADRILRSPDDVRRLVALDVDGIPGWSPEAFLNVHWMTANCGDHNAAVCRYVPGYVERSIEAPAIPARLVVFGGGGLYTQWTLEQARAYKALGATVVLWGVGIVTEDRAAGMTPESFRELGDLADLAGLREPSPWELVPCPSCMSPLFDKYSCADPQRRTVYYDHPAKSLGLHDPRMTNFDTLDLGTVLGFLASGDTVATSSYHGACWATWLGRRVEFRGPAADQLRQAGPWTSLAEARRLTAAFARKVEALL